MGITEGYITRRESVQERLRRLLTLRNSAPEEFSQLLAHKCVQRGVRWLNRHAPSPGWWRNCLDGGRSRVNMGDELGGILPLVYEYERDLANVFGYVTNVEVTHYLRRRYPGINLERLGFSPQSYILVWKPFLKRHPNVFISATKLDRAWASFLKDPPPMMQINYRHPRRSSVLERQATHWPILSEIVDRLRIRGLYDRILPGGRLARS